MGQGELDRHVPLRRADVEERPVPPQGKRAASARAVPMLTPVIEREELAEAGRVLVEHAEEVLARLRFVLRLAGPQPSVSAPQNG